jgi:YggT family protein
MALTIVMRILTVLTSLYMILLIVRILLSWFRAPFLGGAHEILGTITDPYLSYFRRFRVFSKGQFDFSPIAALTVLVVANNIFATIGQYGRVTAGIVIGLTISAVWSAAAFVLAFFAVIAGIRLIVVLTTRNSIAPLWRTLDLILGPAENRIDSLVYRGRIVSFRQSLATSLVVMLALRVLGGLAIDFAVSLIERLPF